MSKEPNQVVFNDETQEVRGNRRTAIKSVVVLVLIAVILGGLLAILNDALFISDEERIANTIKTFYDNEEKSYRKVNVLKQNRENIFGSIDNVYLIEDGNYLLKTTGYHGYKDGTVTLWLLAEFKNDSFNGFIKIRMESYVGQTLMSNFNDSFYQMYIDRDITQGYFSVDTDDINRNVVSGTTKTSVAINNAVNSAYYFINTVLEV